MAMVVGKHPFFDGPVLWVPLDAKLDEVPSPFFVNSFGMNTARHLRTRRNSSATWQARVCSTA